MNRLLMVRALVPRVQANFSTTARARSFDSHRVWKFQEALTAQPGLVHTKFAKDRFSYSASMILISATCCIAGYKLHRLAFRMG